MKADTDTTRWLHRWLGEREGCYLRRCLTPTSDNIDASASVNPVSDVSDITRKIQTIPAVHNINASIARATSGRQLFITSKGYIGLGPVRMMTGDRVAILLGGSTPFVLREYDTSEEALQHLVQWELLGDCYVHGWMDGELVKNERTEEWPWIVLK